jgi:hypothetical protein
MSNYSTKTKIRKKKKQWLIKWVDLRQNSLEIQH